MTDRAEAWNSRPSNDRLLNESLDNYTHHRSMSGQSVSTVMGEPLQREVGGYDNYQYPPQQPSMQHPANAYTQDPGPTPQYTDNYHPAEDLGAGVDKPMATQAHPGEFWFWHCSDSDTIPGGSRSGSCESVQYIFFLDITATDVFGFYSGRVVPKENASTNETGYQRKLWRELFPALDRCILFFSYSSYRQRTSDYCMLYVFTTHNFLTSNPHQILRLQLTWVWS